MLDTDNPKPPEPIHFAVTGVKQHVMDQVTRVSEWL
jgi:hypothetical protein